MTYTNINISDGAHVFKYILEYVDENTVDEGRISYVHGKDKISFVYENDSEKRKDPRLWKNTIKSQNYWTPVRVGESTEHIPIGYNTSVFNLYFPRFAVDTYEKNVKYMISINTWVCGTYVYLGSFLLDRSECLAIPSGPRTFLNDQYYEYVRLVTIDPYFMIYGKEWADFRHEVCGSFNRDTNDGGSNINVSFCPVEYVDGHWIKLTGYEEAQSAMLITSNVNDFLSCNIQPNTDATVVDPRINVSVNFNQTYSQTPEGLADYLKNTYMIDEDNVDTHFVFVVQDSSDAYKYVEHKHEGIAQNDSFDKSEFSFESWGEYKDGMKIRVLFMIRPKDVDADELITISSNEIFLDKELFKFFVGINPYSSVKLNNIDMNNININAVNKVYNQVVQIARPEDYKANIQKPIFVSVQETGNILIHPAVTENIVINLDAYKNKAKVFTLKIKDQVFLEIGRIPKGVVFKVIGTKLEFAEDEETEGTYYILDDEGTLITFGNYKAILA